MRVVLNPMTVSFRRGQNSAMREQGQGVVLPQAKEHLSPREREEAGRTLPLSLWRE